MNRRHVLRDIDPYICLFEECRGDALFKTPEEWLGHMQWEHTVVWACQVPGHEDYRYDSQSELEHHLQDFHADAFSQGHLQDILQKSVLPASDTFAVLALSISSNSQDGQTGNLHQCPLCRKRFPVPDLGYVHGPTPDEGIQNHILAHLETIALISLPHRDDQGARISSSGGRRFWDEDCASSHSAASIASFASGGVNELDEPSTDILDAMYVAPERVESWDRVFREIRQPGLPDPDADPLLLDMRRRATEGAGPSGSSQHQEPERLNNQQISIVLVMGATLEKRDFINALKSSQPSGYLTRNQIGECQNIFTQMLLTWYHRCLLKLQKRSQTAPSFR